MMIFTINFPDSVVILFSCKLCFRVQKKTTLFVLHREKQQKIHDIKNNIKEAIEVSNLSISHFQWFVALFLDFQMVLGLIRKW